MDDLTPQELAQLFEDLFADDSAWNDSLIGH